MKKEEDEEDERIILNSCRNINLKINLEKKQAIYTPSLYLSIITSLNPPMTPDRSTWQALIGRRKAHRNLPSCSQRCLRHVHRDVCVMFASSNDVYFILFFKKFSRCFVFFHL